MAGIKSIHALPDKPSALRVEGMFRVIRAITYEIEIPKQLSEALFGVAQAGLLTASNHIEGQKP